MKHRSIFFSISLVVILSMLVGLIPSTAQPLQLENSPVSLDPGMSAAEVMAVLPRDQTLYFNGFQWTPVSCWNPYNANCNNTMAIAQQDNARVTVFETPYIYNMLTGESFPLLADGPFTWNEARTAITFKIKPAAKWMDGTPVTADDVAYTWSTNLTYSTVVGNKYIDFIDNITALDNRTVLVTAKLDEAGKVINPLMVANYLSEGYVIRKTWTQQLEARSGYDPGTFYADPGLDAISSGPYYRFFDNDQIVVLIRNDSYWGQHVSMWGKLPAPKYLAHEIFPDNESSLNAFKAGEVDVSQEYIANEQDLWLVDGLPISTYLPDAPYQVGATMPTAFYNLGVASLNNDAIRKAIAIAVDYDLIISQAMTNQSATFNQVPRSLMNPSPYEQSLYDQETVKDLQWDGNDLVGARQILDGAGITDSDGNGWREYNGTEIQFTVTCPVGWTDWMAATELIAAAGREIGINMVTNYPDWSEYQNIVTNWPLPAGYDIFMMWSDGTGPTQPWNRIRHLMSSEFAKTQYNWNGNWGGYSNAQADAIIQSIPTETDPAQLIADYTELTRIYLTDIPSFSVMYRPQNFQTVNTNIWIDFPHQDDGSNPPVPPLDLIDGYSIAGLYDLKLRSETLFVADLQLDAPSTFNPLNSSSAWPVSGNYLLTYETLFAYNQVSGKLDPLLAKSLKMLNPTTMQITLQKDTRWQDGQPLTTEDVLFTYHNTSTQPGNGYENVYEYISAIRSTGDRTLEIDLKPDNLNPGMVKYFLSTIKILPAHIWQPRIGDGEDIYGYVETNPVGSGPYKLYEYSSQRIVLTKADDYWGMPIYGQPKPEYIIHPIFSSASSSYQAFLAGNVDMINAGLDPRIAEISQNIGTWYNRVPYQLPGSIPMLIINTTSPGLENPLVRRAMAFSIDYVTIAATAMGQASTPVNSSLILPVGPEKALFNSAQVAKYGWTYNPTKTQTILENQLHAVRGSDGIYILPDNTRLGPWTISTVCGWADWESTVAIVEQSARTAGFDLQISCGDWLGEFNGLNEGSFDLTLWYISSSTPSTPWARFRDMLGARNYSRFSNPAVPGLLYQAGQATDLLKAKALYDQLDRIFMDNAIGIPMMYRPNEFYTFNSDHWSGYPTAEDPSAPPMFSGAGVEVLYQLESHK